MYSILGLLHIIKFALKFVKSSMRPCIVEEPWCGTVELREYEIIKVSEGTNVLLPLFVRMTRI